MAKPPRKNWTRPEQIRALELYLRTPFGRIHNKNPEIIQLANQIGRTANALALKMSNFAALDPTIPQKGMSNYSRSDGEIWAEFFAAPSSFITNISKVASDWSASPTYPQDETLRRDVTFEVREGREVERSVKVRQNQHYFRRMLLASYNGRCAITDIEQKELLIASHIRPWKESEESRLDPSNGILLNSLHDRAFDRGLITFEDDMSLVMSKHLNIPSIAKPFFEDKKLNSPQRFAPNPEYLAYHRDVIFQKSTV